MTMIALISPNEEYIYTLPDEQELVCYRVPQVLEKQQEFPVASPLYWIVCDDFITANDYVFYQPTETFYKIKELNLEQPNLEQPNVVGGIETL